ncbi:MAG: HipA family kinase [Allorhizobium sp.]
MSLQLDIMPCKIRRLQPFPEKRTAYALGYGYAEDGLRYVVKTNGSYPLVCANEWVCTSLAEFLHIPVAPSKILQLPDGELVFGTAVIEPRLSDFEAGKLHFSNALRNEISTPELRSILSSTYVFDLFVGNYDRHSENFIFSLESINGSNEKIARVRAIDYDAAKILENANFELPLYVHTNTVSVGRQIRQSHGFDIGAATNTLSRIQKGGSVMIDRAMFGMPEQWLSKSKRAELEDWIITSKFEQKIEQIVQGISDGTYL